MANPIPTTPPGTPQGGGATAPVAGNNLGTPGQPADKLVTGNSAVVSVPQFGGDRGGKPRLDGLAQGSPEAKAADREKEKLHKRDYRARLRAQNPPTLPAVLPPTDTDPAFPQTGNVAPQASPDSVAQLAWTPEDLREVMAEIVPAWEQETVAKLTRKAATAKLPPKVLQEIEADARWGEMTKKGLIIGGSQLGAKWFNKAGVSTEWKPETVFLTALGRQLLQNRRLHHKLDKLIAAQKAAETPAKPPQSQP